MKACKSHREYRRQYDGDDKNDIYKNELYPTFSYILWCRAAQWANVTKEIENDNGKQNRLNERGQRPMQALERSTNDGEHRHDYAEEDRIGQYGKNSLCKLSFCGYNEYRVLTDKRKEKSE